MKRLRNSESERATEAKSRVQTFLQFPPLHVYRKTEIALRTLFELNNSSALHPSSEFSTNKLFLKAHKYFPSSPYTKRQSDSEILSLKRATEAKSRVQTFFQFPSLYVYRKTEIALRTLSELNNSFCPNPQVNNFPGIVRRSGKGETQHRVRNKFLLEVALCRDIGNLDFYSGAAA
ncbi:hypothetical protein CDAR_444111 [Caerostris darwini]|uniref:Ribosomal protein S4 n=1 Tax=Caerostris darwini TaxID=1538125 RepID=A0AAV4XB17_9ARAC|nr:hypothetical protein CDAR_444111 [Caerostris darwini]